MASSRNSTNRNKRRAGIDSGINEAERALKECLARVSFSASLPAVAIAYSGGLDSSMLLHLAHGLSKQYPLRLFAFHIHHGLNPRADEWLSHCERTAQAYDVPFAARKVRIDEQSGLGVEETARRARYAALGDLCREHGVPLLLTAHHEDDQAETVLLQLLRGAGMPGLSGMPSFSDHHDLLGAGVALGRPLLSISRAMLGEAALHAGVSYVDDDSNLDSRYRRNAIRHRIAPALQELFPSYAQCITRSSRHAQQAQRLLDELAAIDLAACSCNDNSQALNLTVLRTLPLDRIDNLLRFWLHRQGKLMPSEAQLFQIREQMLGAASDSEPRYSCGELHLLRIGSRIELLSDLDEPPATAILLNWEGQESIELPEWKGRLILRHCDEGGISVERLRQGPLVLHPRSEKEKLKLATNRPGRELKKLYQEAAIFPAKRRWLPLVSLQDQLVFAAGLGMDCRACDAVPGIRLHWENP